MMFRRGSSICLFALAATVLQACSGGVFGAGEANEASILRQRAATPPELVREERRRSGTIFDLFSGGDDPNVTVEVNKYIWNAALDILDFMPIETADPFSGVIVYGYGTPPGSGRAYRATVYVQDPALEARSLRLAMQTRGGAAASPQTVRAIEDAILTRARQLRVADARR